MPDVVQVHQVTNMLQRVGRAAGDQSLHRNELGHFQIDAGGTLRGDRANHVALGEHATAVLPSVQTTSLTTSALILLVRINWAATPTVSFMPTVTTRADLFLRRTSPTCMATSSTASCWVNTLYQMSTSLYVLEKFQALDLGPNAARSRLPLADHRA